MKLKGKAMKSRLFYLRRRRFPGAPRSTAGSLAALIMALALSAPALAQEVGSEQHEPFAIPGLEAGAPAEAAEAPGALPQTREERLDALFAELAAAPDEFAATKIQTRIGRLWADSGSDTLNLLLLRGKRAIAAEDYAKAKAHLSRLIAFAPDFAEGWSSRAAAAYADDDYGRALADVTRALELEPRHFAAWSGLGAILEKMDRPHEALAAFRKALEINPFSKAAGAGVSRLKAEVEGRDA